MNNKLDEKSGEFWRETDGADRYNSNRDAYSPKQYIFIDWIDELFWFMVL